MKKGLIKLGIRGVALQYLIEWGERIGKALSTDPKLSTMAAAGLEIVKDAQKLRELEAKAGEAQILADSTRKDRDAKRVELEGKLSRAAKEVELLSNGDRAIIVAAGFALRNEATPIGALPAPQSLSATTGDRPGTVLLAWDKLRGAKSYLLEQCADPPTADGWKHAGACTKSRYTVSGLPKGQSMWFRVAGIGAAGIGPWSGAVSRVVP